MDCNSIGENGKGINVAHEIMDLKQKLWNVSDVFTYMYMYIYFSIHLSLNTNLLKWTLLLREANTLPTSI